LAAVGVSELGDPYEDSEIQSDNPPDTPLFGIGSLPDLDSNGKDSSPDSSEGQYLLHAASKAFEQLKYEQLAPPTPFDASFPDLDNDFPFLKDEELSSYASSTIDTFNTPPMSPPASSFTFPEHRGPGRPPKNISYMKTFFQLRTVRRLWDEYHVGVDGGPSLKSLDKKYGAEWRKHHYHAFRQRMKILKAVERRAEVIGLDRAVNEFESFGSLQDLSRIMASQPRIPKFARAPSASKESPFRFFKCPEPAPPLFANRVQTPCKRGRPRRSDTH